MNVSQQLVARRDGILAKAEAILDRVDAESRAMTAAEQTEYDEHVATAERLNQQIAGAREPVFRSSDPVATAIPPDDVLPMGSGPIVTATLPRSTTLKAFDNTRAGRDAAYRSAKWVQATLLQNGAAYRWCQSHGIVPDVMAAHSGGVNTAGGALVPSELSDTIIRLVEAAGVFRANARVLNVGTDATTIARRKGGLTGYFIGEGTEGTESDTSWDSITLSPKKLAIFSRLSSELSEDSLISMVDLLASECALAMATKEDQCGFVGTGVSTYGGMTGLVYRFENETLAGAVDATATHNDLSKVDVDDVTSLIGALPVYAQANAKWYCSSMAYAIALLPIASSAGGASLTEMQAGMGLRFLGYPVVLTSTLPSSGTLTSKCMLLFGNLAQSSTMGVRRELRFQTSDQRYWTTDEVGIRATERFDIVNHDLGDASTAGPVVALMGKS